MVYFSSLRSKLLLPLAIASMVLLVVVCLLVFRQIQQQQSSFAIKQAFLFANTLNQSTASLSLLSNVRIVVNTMVRQERDIRAIGIATNTPFTVWASSVKESHDQKTIKKRMLRSLVKASKTGEFSFTSYPDGYVEMTVPLDVLETEIAETDSPNFLLAKWAKEVEKWDQSRSFNVLDYYLSSQNAEASALTYKIPDLNAFRGVVYLRVDMSEHIMSTKNTITYLALIFFIGMGTALFIAAYLIHVFVIRPTRRITHVMDAQAEGQRDLRTHLRGQDEIAKISQTFDHMMDSLMHTEEELKVHRDHLQDMVDEKTQHLAYEKKRADEANAAKSQFLATMSHELRTPMTGVIGFSDVLLSSDLPPENREHVQRIKNSAHGLIHVVNDILDMSKLEAGKVEAELIDFDLHALLDNIANNLAPNYGPGTEVKFKLIMGEDLPKFVNSDPNRLRQIMVNLLGNAFKFTKQGMVTLKVERVEKDDASSIIRISVSDTGMGIEKQVLPNLFNYFMQADASISRKFEGTGLGLAISKGLVNLLGGDIYVESTLHEGSCFWFEIPFVAGNLNKLSDKRDYKAGDFKAIRPLNILLAEDNKVNQTLLKGVLEKYGHAIHIANNGLEAVIAVKNTPFDLILMDVHMPEMNGMEATKEIRSFDDIPIIAATADVINDHMNEYMKSGMNSCVSKPFNWPELLISINQVLGEEIHILK